MDSATYWQVEVLHSAGGTLKAKIVFNLQRFSLKHKPCTAVERPLLPQLETRTA